jgi:hypothetical protein
MNAEEYLEQVKNIDLRIRSLEGELNDSQAEEDTEYAEELRDRIAASIRTYKELKLRIRDEIQQIKDNRLSTLLTEFYIRGKSWEDVTAALGMRSVKNVREGLHKKALEAFEKKFQNNFQNTTS